MSKLNSKPLSKEEIEEELLNNDLMRTGGLENEEVQEMNLEEKKNLLRGIKQSKEEFHSEPSSRLSNQSALDSSTSNFPSLPPSGKPNSRKGLKLPRKKPSGGKGAEYEDGSDKCIKPLDEEDVLIQKFNLPFCVDDGASPLPMPERPLRQKNYCYYPLKGEHPNVALRRMLAHHDKWKNAYIAETSKMESHALVEDIEDSDSKEQRHIPNIDKEEEKDNNHYGFASGYPVCSSKLYNGPRKRDTNNSSDSVLQSSRQLQRKASRDSDCEEIEPVLKPEEPKMNEWITATRPKSKRNRKQLINQEKEGSGEVEFDFENKWDARTSSWHGGQAPSPSSSSLNNQSQSRKGSPHTPLTEETKVQCPICQRNFARTKVEAHAATCEGYSGSPMDVEEEN